MKEKRELLVSSRKNSVSPYILLQVSRCHPWFVFISIDVFYQETDLSLSLSLSLGIDDLKQQTD
jgi:hypothetical protein